jgi:hypothetical protein
MGVCRSRRCPADLPPLEVVDPWAGLAAEGLVLVGQVPRLERWPSRPWSPRRLRGEERVRWLQGSWRRFVEFSYFSKLQRHRWRRFIYKIRRARRLQRLYAYCGHHLPTFGKYIRARLRIVFHTGTKKALWAARRDLKLAKPIYDYPPPPPPCE